MEGFSVNFSRFGNLYNKIRGEMKDYHEILQVIFFYFLNKNKFFMKIIKMCVCVCVCACERGTSLRSINSYRYPPLVAVMDLQWPKVEGLVT